MAINNYSLGFLLLIQIFASHPASSQVGNDLYDVEAFRQDGDDEALILRIKPSPGNPSKFRILTQQVLGRQDEDDDDDAPATTPFIPQIIPGVTKIFNGLLTGNLNEIFHGSTSFAPKETSYAIDSVYNTVVGLPPPNTGKPATKAPLAANGTVVNGTAVAAVPVATTIAPVAVTAAPVTASSGDDDDEEENTEISTS